jgi:hypothetical protein
VTNRKVYLVNTNTGVRHLNMRHTQCAKNNNNGFITWFLLLTGIPSSHLHRLIIPDDVLIQFDLLMMSTVMLETCGEVK